MKGDYELFKFVLSKINHGKTRTIIELGCGKGELESFMDANYIGVDLEPIRKKDFKVDITKDRLPCKNSSVDYVIAIEVLEHLHDFSHLFNEIKRVLKHDGLFVATTPTAYRFKKIYRSYLHKKTDSDEHVVSFTLNTINNLFKANGMRVIEQGYFKKREYMYIVGDNAENEVSKLFN